MLSNLLKVTASTSRTLCRSVVTTPPHSKALVPSQIKVTRTGAVTTFEGVPASVGDDQLLRVYDPYEACPLCRLNVEVKFDDVLILRQFMRDDGTVYPRQVTGICGKQQRIVERCVMQAHWSGLFPKNRPIAFEQLDPKLDSDTSRIRLNRHWRSSKDFVPSNYDIYPGSSVYIKRFERADKIRKWKADNEKRP